PRPRAPRRAWWRHPRRAPIPQTPAAAPSPGIRGFSSRLLQGWFRVILRTALEVRVARQDAGTRVPPQQRVVVASWTDGLGLLVSRIDLQHVEADALGLRGLLEEPVPLRLLERLGDRLLGERLELEDHARTPRATGWSTRGRRP